MKIDDIAKEELRGLDVLMIHMKEEVERTVTRIRGKKCRIYEMNRGDQLRLLTLHTWSEYYAVDVQYILSRLLPHWERFVRRRNKNLAGRALGVRVGTLLGKKSEVMLQAFIKEDFPSGQHEELRRQYRQQILLYKESQPPKNGIKMSSDTMKEISNFHRPAGFMQYYRRRMQRQSERREKIIKEMLTRPYRTNPFVAGLIDEEL